MVNLEQLKQDVNNLPEEAQILVTEFYWVIKKSYSVGEKQGITSGINTNNKAEDWADFIGCMEAESDLSRNHKTYLKQKLSEIKNYHKSSYEGDFNPIAR